ncbi:MAG: peroxidase family protein [Parvularculaceae bacterium]
MGLIYVNPEGPNSNPDPLAAAKDIRETFGRMAMNDEETVALIAGGHTFGKAHGAHARRRTASAPNPPPWVSRNRASAGSTNAAGNAGITITSGLERVVGEPGRVPQRSISTTFTPLNGNRRKTRPSRRDAMGADRRELRTISCRTHDPEKRHAPIMFTTDLAMRMDPEYGKISKRFQENPEEFKLAFAKAWFKLTHRDMGPRSRYLSRSSGRRPDLAGSGSGGELSGDHAG